MASGYLLLEPGPSVMVSDLGQMEWVAGQVEKWNFQSMEPTSNLIFSIYRGAENPDLEKRVSQAVIAIQSENQLESVGSNIDAGFLVTCFTEDELNALYGKGSTLFVVEDGGQILGFAMVTPIEIFTKQFAEPGSDFVREQVIDLKFSRYLYQVAVRRGHLRDDIGSRLIEEVKKDSPGPLIADVLVAPFENSASVRFLKRQGFFRVGELRLSNYREFGPLTAEVLYWTKACLGSP